MNLEHIFSLCTQLQQINSTKGKEQFLIDNRCEDFDKFLKFLLDPQIVTGIDRKKCNKNIDSAISISNDFDLGFMLQYLRENNTGRDYDIKVCQCFIKAHKEYEDFLIDVFTKRLKLGVNIALVNKAYSKGFIHVHEVQLGSPRDKLRLKDGEWFSLSQKMNGIRCTYVDGKMISRQGKEFKGLDHIKNQLDEICKDENCSIVFDGELIRKNTDGLSDNENFRLTTSLVNGDGNKSEVEFVLFDCLCLEDFYKGKSRVNYTNRRTALEWIVGETRPNICLVPVVYQGSDQSEIDRQLSIANSKGWEGLMLNKNLPYECKRTTNLIKIKSFKHSDLRIVDCLEGDGKYKGVLGAFIVEFKNNTVNVGSGFTDQEREDYWKDKDNLIGKICQVKYKEISKDKNTGFESLQFPVFESLRVDKTKPSYE